MKENTGSINHLLLTQWSCEAARHIFHSQAERARFSLVQLTKQAVVSVAATLAMGMILFFCLSFFLYQLAEHACR